MKRMINWSYLLLLVLIFGCKSQDPKQGEKPNALPYQEEINSLDSFLQIVNKTEVFPGFAVSVFTKDSIFFERGYGWSDMKNKKKYAPQTVQIIASVSKTLIGVATMRLVQENKMDLDDDINSYLPFEVKNPHLPEEKITLRHLASHTSGIGSSEYYKRGNIFSEALVKEDWPEAWHQYFDGYNGNKTMGLSEFLEKILSEKGEWYNKESFLKHVPGTHYEYSNLGAALLALCVEKASGQTFKEYTQEIILDPAQMENSTWNLEAVNVDLQTTYYLENYKEVPPYSIVTYPDGGLYSSVSDMTKYLQEIMKAYYGESEVLKKESVAEMFRKQYEREDLTEGICWDLSFGGVIGHGGNDFGTATLMYFQPSTGLGRILFTNISTEKDEQYELLMETFGGLFPYNFGKGEKG